MSIEKINIYSLSNSRNKISFKEKEESQIEEAQIDEAQAKESAPIETGNKKSSGSGFTSLIALGALGVATVAIVKNRANKKELAKALENLKGAEKRVKELEEAKKTTEETVEKVKDKVVDKKIKNKHSKHKYRDKGVKHTPIDTTPKPPKKTKGGWDRPPVKFIVIEKPSLRLRWFGDKNAKAGLSFEQILAKRQEMLQKIEEFTKELAEYEKRFTFDQLQANDGLYSGYQKRARNLINAQNEYYALSSPRVRIAEFFGRFKKGAKAGKAEAEEPKKPSLIDRFNAWRKARADKAAAKKEAEAEEFTSSSNINDEDIQIIFDDLPDLM